MATQRVMNGLSRQAGILESWHPSVETPPPKAMLLGLPCAHCKAYFAADLEVCPICGCKERIVIGKRAASVVVM